ncbi:sugar-binding transcriptional regulator [Caldisalinibacter kiritimatiensis]|uniref:Central regulator protein n=1 Tax=Caldisalinibacter kiritimatiensis TaxID=1304284 RepID=R1CVV2_9FIRM|nr:sugar-binding domain-containing protein [Caldisalinibacter kiritimatiensis]EOD00769.1 Central regulator protein [Caldisalinibacter kiritimatiensis]
MKDLKDLIELQKKIVPEVIEILEKRYNILRNVMHNQPIGRRTLSHNLGLGERIIRTEVNILKEQGLLDIKSMGMNITEEGLAIIEKLKDYIYELKGLRDLENVLESKLGIEKVYIVPGDCDNDKLILKDLGKKASIVIKNIIHNDYIIGVTGGTTMAQVSEEMPKQKGKKNVLVLPARGGLGKYLETQANNVAAKLAEKLGGSYKLLHVPDNIGKEALETLLQLPDIDDTVKKIKKMNVLVFGIGRADDMARRRQLSNVLIKELKEKGAVAEAFGHYFNTKGEIIWESNTVGLSLVDFEKVNNVIGVAGGARKAKAIVAICALKKDMTLVTDEGAARKIIELIN